MDLKQKQKKKSISRVLVRTKLTLTLWFDEHIKAVSHIVSCLLAISFHIWTSRKRKPLQSQTDSKAFVLSAWPGRKRNCHYN